VAAAQPATVIITPPSDSPGVCRCGLQLALSPIAGPVPDCCPCRRRLQHREDSRIYPNTRHLNRDDTRIPDCGFRPAVHPSAPVVNTGWEGFAALMPEVGNT
jgi:hypothetical protein